MKGIPQGRYTKECREEAVKLVTEGNMTIPAVKQMNAIKMWQNKRRIHIELLLL